MQLRSRKSLLRPKLGRRQRTFRLNHVLQVRSVGTVKCFKPNSALRRRYPGSTGAWSRPCRSRPARRRPSRSWQLSDDRSSRGVKVPHLYVSNEVGRCSRIDELPLTTIATWNAALGQNTLFGPSRCPRCCRRRCSGRCTKSQEYPPRPVRFARPGGEGSSRVLGPRATRAAGRRASETLGQISISGLAPVELCEAVQQPWRAREWSHGARDA